eukprot:9883392-Prorocentrum_lima.AAC.1
MHSAVAQLWIGCSPHFLCVPVHGCCCHAGYRIQLGIACEEAVSACKGVPPNNCGPRWQLLDHRM